MRKIAVCLSKGGVGKTTTATILAAGLAGRGRRVLLVDCDTQGQTAFFLGVKPEFGLADILLKEKELVEALTEARPGLWLLSGGRRLADATLSISKRVMGIERALLEVLDPAEEHFDFVILDMAPGWDLLSVNALIYATEILAPVELQMAAMESLSQFHTRIADIQSYNPALHLKYLLPTMWDKRSRESQAILNQLTGLYPDAICAPVRSSVRFFESTSLGQTIFEYAPGSVGDHDYTALVNKVDAA